MTALARRLAGIIADEGPLPIDRFMALVLGDPQHGYYMTRDPLGAAGDFTTAPEISQIFGELIGLWAVQTWQSLGAPGHFCLVEFGPGRGTLMADALRAAALVPSFREAAAVHLVETSPVLREIQQATLGAAGCSATWHDTFASIPDGPVIGIANEFFDALPIRQFVSRDGLWLERVIGLAEGRLAFGLSAAPVQGMTVSARDGDLLEIGFAGLALMDALAGRLVSQGGAALIIDYGHTETGFGDTLQAVHKHAFADPLESPGEADLTAHVDFAALLRQARAAGARAHGPVSQATLLARLGARERAAMLRRKASPDMAGQIDSALSRLTGTGPEDMGRLFKAIAVTAPGVPTPAGFEAPDSLLQHPE